jgi:hypothetical protein
MNGASARKTVFRRNSLLTRAQLRAAASIPRAIADSRKWLEQHLAEYRKQTAALTDDFAGMVDIKHGELKDIVLKHAETVKRDALFVSNRLVDANDVAKSIQKNLQVPLPNGINPKTLWNGNGSDLKKSAKNWTMPSIFAASTGILLARWRPVSSPC